MRRSSQEVKQEKIAQLKRDITKLRQRKAVLRLELSQQQQNARAEEFRYKLDAIDRKIVNKMQELRDTISGRIQQLGGPVEIAQRAWDQWRI